MAKTINAPAVGKKAGLSFVVGRYGICVPLTKRQWNKLQKLDDSCDGNGFLEVVNPALVKAGALDSTVEYNGHFGANVFFDTDTLEEAQAVTDQLAALLEA